MSEVLTVITYYIVAYDKLKRSAEDRNIEQHTS